MIEKRIVPGYEWLTVDRNGNCWNTRFQRPFKGEIDKYGYKRINTRYEGKRARCLVHRAVALAFIPNPNDLPTVNHINAIKDDNRVENLEWATHQNQADHVKKLGLKPIQYGEDTSGCKYSENFIREICKHIEDGWRNCDITSKFKVQQHLVSDIRNRKSWGHVSKDYDFKSSRSKRLSVEAVTWVCKQLQMNRTPIEIFKKTVNVCITLSIIKEIKMRNIYRNISKNYTF